MRLLLTTMPWQAIETPSIALGILRAKVESELPQTAVQEYHAQFDWADLLLDRSDGAFTPIQYNEVGNFGFFDGLGDWVFSGVLYDNAQWGVDRLLEYSRLRGTDIALATAAREHAADFVAIAVRRIVESRPDVVGFTTTHMQNVASLAVAKRVKEHLPNTRIVFGGANCDGPKGSALHRNHPWIDFVVRGEGERPFISLLTAMRDGKTVSEIPGLCWWEKGRSVTNPMLATPLSIPEIPQPVYDEWYAAFKSSQAPLFMAPQLLIEGARGCWWGEKHHCTFCGLNGTFMKYRSKSPERFLKELKDLVQRYQILDIVPVENIMAMEYVREVLPALGDLDWDLRMHYELKANLREDQVAMLASAGIVQVQFGIESLSTRVLTLMDKGVSGPMNVRLLRDCEENGVTVGWNYLYGFPGETDEDYESIMRQVPALLHLQPPSGASRLAVERFSPYFTKPELGFTEPRAASFYRHLYDLPESELADLAHVFETEPAGIGQPLEGKFAAELHGWEKDYTDSRLTMAKTRDRLIIRDDRARRRPVETELTGWREAVYTALRKVRSPEQVARAISGSDHQVELGQVREYLDELKESGLVFHDGDLWVALATTKAGVHVPR